MIPQQSIGHYRIVFKLGEGGMGAVYRATDSKLNRDVAVKVVPEVLAQDSDRMARFRREAQVLASLNHPNIAAIYGVEDLALVMELVEGEHLQGPMPLEQALPVIHQLIDALEYAHEKGIVHRDLKPANIKVTPEGRVKVLDFGLAKAMSGQQAVSGNPQSSPTLTMRATMAGVIMGTAGYMAPEQARGHDADKRADIWAFGAVVYELLTGEQLFAGSTVSDSLAAVLTRDPDLQRVPAELRKLVRLCLVRDVKQRLRDIGDARIVIADGVGGAASPSAPAGSSRLPWMLAAAVFALSSLIFAGLWMRRPVEETPTVQFTAPPPDKGSFYDTVPVISPDGRHIVFGSGAGGKPQLWVRDLATNTARPLAGTDEGSLPFWSPDSRSLGFFANSKLKKIDLSGGPALTLADARFPRGGAWSHRDIIVFNAGDKVLSSVSASGENPAPVTEINGARNETDHRWPSFLPDGRHFLFVARSREIEKTAIWVGDLDSKEQRMILIAASNAIYDPRGLILFMRGNTLMAQPFDAKRLATTGDAFTVADRVDYTLATLLGYFSISQTGALAYFSGGTGAVQQLTWFDRAGKPVGTVGQPGRLSMFSISPDGGKVAFDRMDERNGFFDIWLYDLTHDTNSRFTFDSDSRYPAWSPDGSRLAFLSLKPEKFGLYMKAISGTAQEDLLFESPTAVGTGWSRDGKFVFFTPVSENTGQDIWVVANPLDPATRKSYPFLQSAAHEGYGSELSPDGKWLAYSSNENGSYQIYLESFPGKDGKFQISANGGIRPVWSRDGKELFYMSPDRKLMAVEVKTSPRFEHAVPKPLFDLPIQAVNSRFDVSPDGKRFLAAISMGDAKTKSLTVVLNWHAGVKK